MHDTTNERKRNVGLFLSYNLIRLLMGEAALQADISPRKIKFKHTLQICYASIHHLWGAMVDDHQVTLLIVLIAANSTWTNPLGRIESRAVKKNDQNLSHAL